jgi:hypothetical protein
MTKIAGSRSISQRHGSADPDPHQNVMDLEHWFQLTFLLLHSSVTVGYNLGPQLILSMT